MELTVTIPEPLAHTLHTLAVQRGIPVETLAQQALVAGMSVLQVFTDSKETQSSAVNRPLFPPVQFASWSGTESDTPGEAIVVLGAVHPNPIPNGYIFTMPSPIIAAAPVPVRTLVPIEASTDTSTSDEN